LDATEPFFHDLPYNVSVAFIQPVESPFGGLLYVFLLGLLGDFLCFFGAFGILYGVSTPRDFLSRFCPAAVA
jgi:hypothetical protein